MENFLFSNTKKENSLFSDTNKSDQNDSLFFSDTEKTNSASKYFFETIKYNPRADSATDKQPDSFWKVLIVDDESDIHTVTKISLKNFDFKGKKVKLLHAFSAMDAKEILRKNPDIALVLLDVVMEKNNAGLELVQYLRNELSNPFTRVVLRTGQPGQAPEKDVVDLYEIDDYKLKTELTIEKLLSVVTTSLRNFDIFMEIENNRKDFDKQVKDRTKDLEHKKNELEKAQQIAKSIDEGEENFLENMSYEIRTPLYSVIGLTELLASNENIDDSQKEIIDVILSSGDNIISIIDDIIDISKIDDQEFNIKKEPMSLSKCLEKNLKVLNSTAAKKKIILTQNIAPGVPDGIICDEVRLSQIIINLVSNAIKFSDHGTVDILVKKQIDHSALSTDNNSINLEISVTDQGIGIPSEKIDCLFKRFSQTDVSTFRNFGGTGLGLAISKKLCELMGGKIWVESIPEKGSTFYFTINTSEVKNIEFSTESNNNIDSYEKEKSPRTLQTLIVDDNIPNCKVTRAWLNILGHKVDIVHNGIEALEATQKNNYDIIFMDLQMPKMDGLETTQKIRNQSCEENSPIIIALTAQAHTRIKKKCLESGMDDFISKPTNFELMKKTLSKWEKKIDSQ